MVKDKKNETMLRAEQKTVQLPHLFYSPLGMWSLHNTLLGYLNWVTSRKDMSTANCLMVLQSQMVKLSVIIFHIVL